jgi:hypothetical protein
MGGDDKSMVIGLKVFIWGFLTTQNCTKWLYICTISRRWGFVR